MPTCAARDCQNRTGMDGPKKTFHMFPKNPSLRERWLYVTGRRNWVPGPRAVLCSDHFEEQCFDRTGQTTRLRAGALPTRGKFTPRRKGRGAVKLEPFYTSAVKKEPQDPSYAPFTTPSPPKKKGPGRPRKHPLPEAVQEQTVDDPAPPPQQEDHPHLDHYYCRNYHETQSLLRQKEKKAEYLKMKLQYLEGETRVKQEPPDWSQFRRATLMEEAEEVRRQLRLSGKLPPVDGRRKTGRGQTLTMKTGKIELVTRNNDQGPKKVQIMTGKSGEKIEVVTGSIDEITGRSEMTNKTDGATGKIQVLTGSADRPIENIKIVTTTPACGTGTIQLVAEEPDRRPEWIQVLAKKADLDFGEDEPDESLEHLNSENKLRQKEVEVNGLLKKIKTLQQRKRREKRRSKARFFRYVVMVEPTKKKRGRKKLVESDVEEDEDEEEDGEDEDEQDENEEEEEEDVDDVKYAADPVASIQDSILSHTASLMMKQQRSNDLIQKDKEIRELRRSMREIQEREKERLEQIQHLQDVISYLKSDSVKTLGTDDQKAGHTVHAPVEHDEERLRRIEDVAEEVVIVDSAVEVEGSESDSIATLTKRYCHMCQRILHQRCHRQPPLWSPSTLDSPPSFSPPSFLPSMHSSIHRKPRLSPRPDIHSLCLDCKIILGKRKRSQPSIISSLGYSC